MLEILWLEPPWVPWETLMATWWSGATLLSLLWNAHCSPLCNRALSWMHGLKASLMSQRPKFVTNARAPWIKNMFWFARHIGTYKGQVFSHWRARPNAISYGFAFALSAFTVDWWSSSPFPQPAGQHWASAPFGHGVQHLFTDGTHTADGRFETHRAAWGLHNATSHRPICSGHLAGLPQKLSTVIAAIQWSLFWRVQVHIWLDALEMQKDLQQRLDGHRTSVADSNADLWIIADELLATGATALLTTTWIPSHLDQTKCESPFEEWIGIHNGIADSLAARCNEDRPSFRQPLAFQKRWDERHTRMMQKLRNFYFAIFERDKANKRSAASISDRIQRWGKWESFVQFSWCPFNRHGPFTFCTNLRISCRVSAIFVRLASNTWNWFSGGLFLLAFWRSLLVFWRFRRCSPFSKSHDWELDLDGIEGHCSRGQLWLIFMESFKRCFGIFADTGVKALPCAKISINQHLEWPFRLKVFAYGWRQIFWHPYMKAWAFSLARGKSGALAIWPDQWLRPAGLSSAARFCGRAQQTWEIVRAIIIIHYLWSDINRS